MAVLAGKGSHVVQIAFAVGGDRDDVAQRPGVEDAANLDHVRQPAGPHRFHQEGLAGAGDTDELLLSPKDTSAPTLADAADQGLLPTWEDCQELYAALRARG